MNFENMMSQLRKEYVSSLPEKIQTIRHFMNSGDHLGVREVFHKLKGTGATYGVPEISTLGETLEAYVSKNPAQLKEAVPAALEILSKVHTLRLNDQPYNVSEDQNFIRIKQLTRSA